MASLSRIINNYIIKRDVNKNEIIKQPHQHTDHESHENLTKSLLQPARTSLLLPTREIISFSSLQPTRKKFNPPVRETTALADHRNSHCSFPAREIVSPPKQSLILIPPIEIRVHNCQPKQSLITLAVAACY